MSSDTQATAMPTMHCQLMVLTASSAHNFNGGEKMLSMDRARAGATTT
jgi:hypothetical protein